MKWRFHTGTGEHRARRDWYGGTEYKTLCGKWVRRENIVPSRLSDCRKCIKRTIR